DSRVRFAYREAENPTSLYSPAVVAAPGTPHTLRLAIGGKYSDYDGHRLRLRGQFDGQTLWDLPAVSLDAFPGTVNVAGDPAFSHRVHSTRPIAEVTFVRPTPAGARVRVT